jgi:hypothetical protein
MQPGNAAVTNPKKQRQKKPASPGTTNAAGRYVTRPKDDRGRALAVLAKVGITDPANHAGVQDLVACFLNVESAHAYHKSQWRFPPEKPGRPVVLAIRLSIDCAIKEGWTWREAAAAVFLFAVARRSYKTIWLAFKDHAYQWLKKIPDSENKSRG